MYYNISNINDNITFYKIQNPITLTETEKTNNNKPEILYKTENIYKLNKKMQNFIFNTDNNYIIDGKK